MGYCQTNQGKEYIEKNSIHFFEQNEWWKCDFRRLMDQKEWHKALAEFLASTPSFSIPKNEIFRAGRNKQNPIKKTVPHSQQTSGNGPK